MTSGFGLLELIELEFLTGFSTLWREIKLELVCSSDSCEKDDCVRLKQRKFVVWGSICTSAGQISFSQLKHSAELHQEILSRIIRRLVVHSVVKRSECGYECDCTIES